MIRLATDEDFNNDILRALRRTLPNLDVLTVREAGYGGCADPEVLAWAAEEDRVLLTHDVTTMTRHALDRVARGDGQALVHSDYARHMGGPALRLWFQLGAHKRTGPSASPSAGVRR